MPGTRITPEQIALIEESFASVAPIADTAAELFYQRLFQIEPAVRPLFRGDMKRQGRMLMVALASVVHRLHAPQRLAADLGPLAARHVAYGVEDRHYAVVGEALLWTLAQGLGEAFTPAVRDAWAAGYALISETMMEAAGTAPLAMAG